MKHVLNTVVGLTSTLAVALLCGCGKSPSAPAAVSPASLMNQSRPGQSQGPLGAPRAAIPKPDLSVPESSYVDLNQEPQGRAMTYLVTSHDASELTDDAKLSRFSPAYYSETDSFKRRDIAAAELPHINAALNSYKQQNYYWLPIGLGGSAPIVFSVLSMSPYDITSRSFNLSVYGSNCWAGTIRAPQGAAVSTIGSTLPCKFEVKDERSARAVEAARAANTLELSGRLYLFVPTASRGIGDAIVTRAAGEFRNRQTHEVLGTFEIHG